MAKVYKCDRCGVYYDEQPENKNYLEGTFSVLRGRSPAVMVDLCGVCCDSLINYLDRWWKKVEVDARKLPPPPPQAIMQNLR